MQSCTHKLREEVIVRSYPLDVRGGPRRAHRSDSDQRLCTGTGEGVHHIYLALPTSQTNRNPLQINSSRCDSLIYFRFFLASSFFIFLAAKSRSFSTKATCRRYFRNHAQRYHPRKLKFAEMTSGDCDMIHIATMFI